MATIELRKIIDLIREVHCQKYHSPDSQQWGNDLIALLEREWPQ